MSFQLVIYYFVYAIWIYILLCLSLNPLLVDDHFCGRREVQLSLSTTNFVVVA